MHVALFHVNAGRKNTRRRLLEYSKTKQIEKTFLAMLMDNTPFTSGI